MKYTVIVFCTILLLFISSTSIVGQGNERSKCLEQIALEYYLKKIKQKRLVVFIDSKIYSPNFFSTYFCFDYDEISLESNKGENLKELQEIQCRQIDKPFQNFKKVSFTNQKSIWVKLFKKKKIRNIEVLESFNLNDKVAIVIVAELSLGNTDTYYTIKIDYSSLKVIDYCKSELSS